MQTYNAPAGRVYKGSSLYVNKALKNGSFAWRIELDRKQITRGCLFQPAEPMNNAAHTMYFVPDKTSEPYRYQPDFEHAVRVDALLLAGTRTDAKTYLDGIENAAAEGNASEFPDNQRIWMVDKAGKKPVPCILASMDANGTVLRYAIPIAAYNTDGSVSLDYDKMLPAHGRKFSGNYSEARRLSANPVKRPVSRWNKELAAAERLVRDINAGAAADGNVVKMPATEVVRTIQEYMDAVYKTAMLNIRVRLMLTDVGEWYCVLVGPFQSDNVRTIRAVHQDNSMAMRGDVLAKGVMCRRLCEKLLKNATGLNVRTSVVIPGIPEINLICD